MTFVITDACVGSKDASCVEVCPVDCIHPTPDEPGFHDSAQLFVDPDECIDCDACAAMCPVDAIMAERDVPEAQRHAIALNAAYYA